MENTFFIKLLAFLKAQRTGVCKKVAKPTLLYGSEIQKTRRSEDGRLMMSAEEALRNFPDRESNE
jgi:hypothetical protein